jgi:two-component system, NtrC family, response regulator AtoC
VSFEDRLDADLITIPGQLLAEPRLVLIVLGQTGIREFELPLGACVLGRSASADIDVNDRSISRAHARIVRTREGVQLMDLGSRNGTFVNDVAVGAEGKSVRPGDTIRFGHVSAQLHQARTATPEQAALMTPEEFDRKVAEDAGRCVRYDRSMAVVTVEVDGRPEDVVDIVRPLRMRGLRLVDGITLRAGRLDLLISEASKDEAVAIARQVVETLTRREIAARLGVAAFPGDAPSAESLLLAAELAMRNAREGIAVAQDAARILHVGAREVVVAEPSMVRLFGLVERMATVPMPVLVTGETGTGKEIIAEALHFLGPRARGQLVKLNCAAVPETLLEAELFGYERGAFSGATAAKPGLFEQAASGTLFLDEIGEMSGPLQAKLLRVLEDNKVRRLGAVRDRFVDVRVVVATHRDLETAVAEQRFREDLLYRLNTLMLAVPPLRERPREIALLAERFALEAARASGIEPVKLGRPLLAALEAYRWPGNVRELRNVVSRAVVTCEGKELGLAHLPPAIARAAGKVAEAPAPSVAEKTGEVALGPLDEQVRAFERERIVRALESTNWNQTKAAALLEIPRRTFVSRLASLGISRPHRPSR